MPGYTLLRRPRQRAFLRVLRSVLPAVPLFRSSAVPPFPPLTVRFNR